LFDVLILAYRAVRVILRAAIASSNQVAVVRDVSPLEQRRVPFFISYVYSLGNLGTPADIRFALAFASSLRRFCWPSCIRNCFFVGDRPPPLW